MQARGASTQRLPRVAPLWVLVWGAAVLALTLVSPRTARADLAEDIASTAERVEEATTAYNQASEHLRQVQDEIAANEQRMAEIQEQLPAQRERSSDSIRMLYKMQQSTGGLLDLVLSSENFSTLLSTLQYLNIISERNTVEVTHLVDMVEELSVIQTNLEAQRNEAQAAADEAQAALDEAVRARDAAQARAAAQAAAEEAAARAALEAAAAAAAAQQSFTTSSGNQAQVVVSDQPVGDASVVHENEQTATSSDDASAESDGNTGTVEEWAARIDAYLAGSPLAGYGRNFAQAALDYGVDPRWSPAISCIESSKGRYCFRSCNAWGWGNVSWGSWDEAIDAHVRGLAAGYGYTISLWAAQKYCPPNWEYWYACVKSEMSRI